MPYVIHLHASVGDSVPYSHAGSITVLSEAFLKSNHSDLVSFILFYFMGETQMLGKHYYFSSS
jgi:hypothetical protein